MHKVRLSSKFRAALRERRNGREHVFDTIDPKRTALLVIDMQDAFVAPGGILEVPLARGIVDNINRLANQLRALGSTIVWLRSTFTNDGPGSFSVYFDYIAPGNSAGKIRSNLSDGGEGHDFWHELDRHENDLIVNKNRFSAFVEGASDLDQELRERDIESLVVAGTLTNICCESTVRDAMMLDYHCIVIEDANAAQSDAEHLAALENIARVFGDVRSSEEFLAKILHAQDLIQSARS